MNNWIQGTYKVKNKEKYIGDKPPYFRSNWEKRTMYWCDENLNVLRWASEAISIPYTLSEGGSYSNHKYFPDFYIEAIDKDGKLVKKIIEIKPKEQCPVIDKNNKLILPNPPKNKTVKSMRRYYNLCKVLIKNYHKWMAARIFCERNGLEFCVLTKYDVDNLF